MVCNLDYHVNLVYIQSQVPDGEDDEGEMDGEHKAAFARYKMVDARLRRLCERKKSGKLKVPEAVHKAWAQGGSERDNLRALLEQAEFDQDSSRGGQCTSHISCTFLNCVYIYICTIRSKSVILSLFINKTKQQLLSQQATFVCNVVKQIEKRNEHAEEVLSGWFTPEQMKNELKWSPTLK